MNNSNPTEPLDRLLHRWADEQAPSAADLDRLTGKIVQAVDEEPESSGERLMVASSPVLRLGPASWFALGAASVVLLALGFLWLAKGTSVGIPEVAETPDLPPSYAWLQDEQLRSKSILLNEMEAVFGRELNWLAETGENVQVDVEPQLSTRGRQALAVRVVVQRRPVGQPDWSVAWAVDVVTRSEELVRLSPQTPADPQFEMWAYALPDGMIALDTEMSFSDTSPVRSAARELQSDGEPREVFKTEAGGFEFRVFQTAAVLNDRLS